MANGGDDLVARGRAAMEAEDWATARACFEEAGDDAEALDGLGQALQIALLSHISLHELDPGGLQPRQVQLRAATVEVVEGEDLPLRMARRQRNRQVGAHEAGPAGNQ